MAFAGPPSSKPQEYFCDTGDSFASGAGFIPLSDVLEGRSWADVSYDEAKELAMEARSFRPTGGDVASDATPFPEPSFGRPSERGASI